MMSLTEDLDLAHLSAWKLHEQARRTMNRQPRHATALLMEMRRRRPDDPQVLRDLAHALYRADDLQRAHDVLREALRMVEDDRLCVTLLVKVLRRQGRSGEASYYYWRHLSS